MKYHNQINQAIQIIRAFQGDMPLHGWLKRFFREHKQMGSNDRKQLSEMAYCFYRLGHAFKDLSTEERILTGLFLCHPSSNELLRYFKPSWTEPPVIAAGELEKIFPWKDQLSAAVDHPAFCASFLVQPDLFIRIRPGFENAIRKKLTNAAVVFNEIGPHCLSFANATRLDNLIELNKEAVIQDLNSQRMAELMNLPARNGSSKPEAWDCCAGSGGKSILLYDMSPSLNITVSDKRESILANLKKRFREAGIKEYHSFTSNLGAEDPVLPTPGSTYDLIIADVPCSGSGVWSRTPEALFFYDTRETRRYNELQKKIVSTIIPRLKKGGVLVYITCSVFKEENEAVVDFIQEKFQLQLESSELFKGYDKKADSMFAAKFKANGQ